jgi:hypothetical protein
MKVTLDLNIQQLQMMLEALEDMEQSITQDKLWDFNLMINQLRSEP